jgi:hypothetical protein
MGNHKRSSETVVVFKPSWSFVSFVVQVLFVTPDLPVQRCGNSLQYFCWQQICDHKIAPIINPAAHLRGFSRLSLSLNSIFLNFRIAPTLGIDHTEIGA